METENKKTPVEITQITFKLSPYERLEIQNAATELDINVSEYCRLKCLANENRAIEQQNAIVVLEKECISLKVKLAYYNTAKHNENSIILNLTHNQYEIIEELYDDFINSEKTLSENITEALLLFATLDELRSSLFKHITATKDKMYEAFYA